MAAALKYDEDTIDKNDPKYGQLTFQALAALETLALYSWWKNERKNRPDPHDASGWSGYCDARRKEAELLDENFLDSIFSAKKSDDEQSAFQN